MPPSFPPQANSENCCALVLPPSIAGRLPALPTPPPGRLPHFSLRLAAWLPGCQLATTPRSGPSCRAFHTLLVMPTLSQSSTPVSALYTLQITKSLFNTSPFLSLTVAPHMLPFGTQLWPFQRHLLRSHTCPIASSWSGPQEPSQPSGCLFHHRTRPGVSGGQEYGSFTFVLSPALGTHGTIHFSVSRAS